MRALRVAFVVAFVLISAGHALGQALQRPVPFKLPARDTTFSQYLPQSSGIAGAHGALSLDTNGHILAKDGARMRFFGTELNYTTNFLSSLDAHTLARRLQKLGFNAVRLVYDDYYGWDASSLFRVYDSVGNVNYYSYKVNYTQLAKLDTLLHEFKQAGIYTFLTLNSAHSFGILDSIPGYATYGSYYSFASRFVDPKAADLERRWVRSLLTHLNPLTGQTYADDPAIAVAEITWQNSLYYYWQLNRLNYVDSSDVAPNGNYTVSYYLSRQFDSLYNAYLLKKYHNDAALTAAWQGNPNPPQQNLMEDGSFEDPTSTAWAFQATSTTKAAIVDADGGVDSLTYKKIRITDVGATPTYGNIFFQYTSSVSNCGLDSEYQISFWAKMPFNATRPTELTRDIYLYVDSYTGATPANLGVIVTIDTSWKQYTFRFRAVEPGVQTIVLYMGQMLGDVWLDAFSLRHAAEIGLLPGESMLTSTVNRLTPSNIAQFPYNRVRDQVRFLDSLQLNYYKGIATLIKDTLHFSGLVNFTQANYWGLTPDQYINSFGDVTEGVVGWDYLNARGTKGIDSTNWSMANTAETKNANAGNMGYYLPSNSVAGKAYIGTVGTPSITQMTAEQMLLVPAYAAYQDWDGVFFEMYSTTPAEVFADHILNYFKSETYHYYAISANSALLALAPIASNMFRNGYIASSGLYQQIEHDVDDVLLAPISAGSRGPWGVEGYLDPNIITALKVRQKFDAPLHKVAAQYAYVADTSAKLSDTGELLWNQTDGTFTINAPNVNGAAGLFATDPFTLSGIRFNRLDNTRDMFTLYYETEDGLSLDSSAHAFLTISPRVQNTGLHWIDSVGFGPSWGTAPMLMNAQRVSLSFKSAFDSVLIYPLDSMGQLLQVPFGDGYHTAEITALKQDSSNWFSASIDQSQYPAVWFYVVKKNSTASVASRAQPKFNVTIAPNPADQRSAVRIASQKEVRVSISIFDDLGRNVQSVCTSELLHGEREFEFSTSSLAAGHYTLRIATPDQTMSRSLNVIR